MNQEFVLQNVEDVWILDIIFTNQSHFGMTQDLEIEIIKTVGGYDIVTKSSISYLLEDKAPPRVLRAYINGSNGLYPHYLIFYTEVEEFGSGIAEIVLYYSYNFVNKTAGIGTQLVQDETTWYQAPMNFEEEYKNSKLYSITVDFIHNNSNIDIIYWIYTMDKVGNNNSNMGIPNESQYFVDRFYLYEYPFDFNKVFSITLIMSIVTFSAVGSAGYLVYRHERKKQLILRNFEQEFKAIKSIRMIFGHNQIGLQFYNEQIISNFRTDIDLLSGFSVAFSKYLDNISSMITSYIGDAGEIMPRVEFELLSRKGLHILIWNGPYSSFVIVSQKVLPMKFRSILRCIGKEIDKEFSQELNNSILSTKTIPTIRVREIVRNYLSLYFCGPLMVNESLLHLNEGKLSKKERHMLDMISHHENATDLQYISADEIVTLLSIKYCRNDAIKFIKKAVNLNLLLELSLHHSNQYTLQTSDIDEENEQTVGLA